MIELRKLNYKGVLDHSLEMLKPPKMVKDVNVERRKGKIVRIIWE